MAGLTNTTINDTGFLVVPSGTTAQRPATPVVGDFRYNTTLTYYEVWDGTEWQRILGVL